MEKIEIVFIPEDFKNNYYDSHTDCPLARAIKRTTGKANVFCGSITVSVGLEKKGYFIEGYFQEPDYQKVKASLAADPSARHTLNLTKI